MRRIIGIIMVVVSGFFIFAGVKAIVKQPGTNKQLKEAPFITDGKLDPANEGKTVIVLIDISDVGDAYDDEFGFSFSAPCVMRRVEKLTCTLTNKKWEWVNVTDSEDSITSRSFFGDIQNGGFQIDGDLLRSLALYRDFYPSDFDEAELSDFLEYYNGLDTEIWHDRFYITDAPLSCFDNYEDENDYIAVRQEYQEMEGALRVSYKGLDREDYSKIAVIGKQQGNWIVEDERVDSLTAFDNAESIEELIGQNNIYLTIGILIALLPCIFILILGIRFITAREI